MALTFNFEQRQERQVSSKIAASVTAPASREVIPSTVTKVWTSTEVVTGTGVPTGIETQTRTDSQAETDLLTESDTSTASTAWTKTTDSNDSSATESAVASATSEPSNNGLDDRQVAAVAISCLVAGVIIGAIIVSKWHAFRAKRRQRYYKRSRRNELGFRFMNQPPDATLVTMNPSVKHHPRDTPSMTTKPEVMGMRLENVVLQPASDKDIITYLHRLEEIIMQHVEVLYHSDPVDVNVAKLARALSTLGISESLSGFHAETVADWCLKPDSRSGALKHVISHVLFRAIDWNSPGSLTLLPEHAISFLNATRPARENKKNLHAMSFAWTRWRTLSALFMHPAPHERTALEVDESDIENQAENVAEALDSLLCLFVAGEQQSRREQHLRLMIVETAKLGYVFFSHTGEWRFIYKDDSGKRRPVVCVGLDKLSGGDGHPLSSPQRIVDPRLLS